MKTTNSMSIFAVLLMCLLMISIASSATISFEPSVATLAQGATTNITLVLDSVPNGLAGYNLNVALSNPNVAQFISVSFPDWATLNNVTYPSTGVVRLSGVDLGRAIHPGDSNIILGTITIRGINGGSTNISINAIRMDAQGGSGINPTVSPATLTIQGGTTSGGGGGYSAGGTSYTGGGGGYSGGGVVDNYAGNPSVSGNTTTVTETTAAIQNTVTPSNTQSTSFSQATVTPISTPLPITSIISSPGKNVPAPSRAAIPWTMIIEVIVVIGIIGAILVLYFLKKAKLF